MFCQFLTVSHVGTVGAMTPSAQKLWSFEIGNARRPFEPRSKVPCYYLHFFGSGGIIFGQKEF